MLGRAQRLGASQPEHRGATDRSQCRDEQDIFDPWDLWDHQDPREYRQASEILKSARSLQRLGAEMLPQPAEKGSLLVAMGLQVLAAVRATDPAEQQPERQARVPELRALRERRQVEPLQQAQPKPVRRAHPGAAERWRVWLHPREKLQALQAEERRRAPMQLWVPGRLRELLALPERPEAPRAGQDALWRRQSWRLYQPPPLLPERRGQENVCVRVRLCRGRASSSAFSFRLRRFRAGSRSGLSP